LAAFLALAFLAAPAGANCPCPKQKMAEMFGTVSAIAPQNSPRLPPPALGAAAIAERRLAGNELPRHLPLNLPASALLIKLDQRQLMGHSD
jgi:hypothetical protein